MGKTDLTGMGSPCQPERKPSPPGATLWKGEMHIQGQKLCRLRASCRATSGAASIHYIDRQLPHNFSSSRRIRKEQFLRDVLPEKFTEQRVQGHGGVFQLCYLQVLDPNKTTQSLWESLAEHLLKNNCVAIASPQGYELAESTVFLFLFPHAFSRSFCDFKVKSRQPLVGMFFWELESFSNREERTEISSTTTVGVRDETECGLDDLDGSQSTIAYGYDVSPDVLCSPAGSVEESGSTSKSVERHSLTAAVEELFSHNQPGTPINTNAAIRMWLEERQTPCKRLLFTPGQSPTTSRGGEDDELLAPLSSAVDDSTGHGPKVRKIMPECTSAAEERGNQESSLSEETLELAVERREQRSCWEEVRSSSSDSAVSSILCPLSSMHSEYARTSILCPLTSMHSESPSVEGTSDCCRDDAETLSAPSLPGGESGVIKQQDYELEILHKECITNVQLVLSEPDIQEYVDAVMQKRDFLSGENIIEEHSKDEQNFNARLGTAISADGVTKVPQPVDGSCLESPPTPVDSPGTAAQTSMIVSGIEATVEEAETIISRPQASEVNAGSPAKVVEDEKQTSEWPPALMTTERTFSPKFPSQNTSDARQDQARTTLKFCQDSNFLISSTRVKVESAGGSRAGVSADSTSNRAATSRTTSPPVYSTSLAAEQTKFSSGKALPRSPLSVAQIPTRDSEPDMLCAGPSSHMMSVLGTVQFLKCGEHSLTKPASPESPEPSNLEFRSLTAPNTDMSLRCFESVSSVCKTEITNSATNPTVSIPGIGPSPSEQELSIANRTGVSSRKRSLFTRHWTDVALDTAVRLSDEVQASGSLSIRKTFENS